MSSLRGSIRSTRITPLRWVCSSSIRRAVSAASSGVSAAPRHSTSWTSAGSLAAARSRYGHALLAGVAAHEDHARPVRVNAEGTDDVLALVPVPQAHVDAVVHHLDLGRVHVGVAAQDVLPHALRHGDDGGRGLVGGLFHPGGQRVAAAELLGLPRAQRLQAVGAEHMRDAVQQRGDVPGHVGVPGVRMHQVRAGDVRNDPQIHPQGLDARRSPRRDPRARRRTSPSRRDTRVHGARRRRAPADPRAGRAPC